MPSKLHINFRERLEKMSDSSEEIPSYEKKKQPCSLSYQKTCCQGNGFVLENKGMFAHARLCPCIDKCSSCRGKMLIVEDGIARSCKKPNPKFVAHLFNEAKIPSRYTFSELKDFANPTGNAKDVVAQIKEWEHRFHKAPNKGLVIYGAIGVGKTFILAALARNFIFRGISVKFVDFFQLVTQIRASYSLNQSEQKIMQPLMEVDILIIDELGKGRNSEFELTVLDQIIMGRYNQNKILIASTNYPLEGPSKKKNRNPKQYQVNLETPNSYKRDGVFSEEDFSPLVDRIDPRIMSRLKETTEFLSLTGDDYRAIKGNRERT